MARSSNGYSALSRALRVLESFDPSNPDLSLTQIAARTGFPISSVHGIASELVSLGLLERRDREFILGVRLWEVAVRAPGVFGLREIALPFLERIRDSLSEHAQLGILQGSEVLYLERLSHPESTTNFTHVGRRLPWYTTSSGFVLVSDAAPEVSASILREPRRRHFDEPQENSLELRRHLGEVRQNGFSVTKGYIHSDSTAVAVPVTGPNGRTVASLAVVVATKGFSQHRVLSVLIPAARAISRGLHDSFNA